MDNQKARSFSAMQRMTGNGTLSVSCRDGVTVLERLFQQGCARLRFPDHDPPCFEGVMINTAGGMTGGDHLQWDIRLDRGTQVMLTTQAAEKIYRSADFSPATIDVRLSVGEKSRLCWLPQETILFNRSSLKRRLDVDMADHAEILLGESVVFGRRMMGESLDEASFLDHWVIRRNGEIIHAEACRLGPDTASNIRAPVCLNGGGAMATVLLVAADAGRYLEPARALLENSGGVSSWNGKLLARIICRDFYSLRKRMDMLVGLLNINAGMPKMWTI